MVATDQVVHLYSPGILSMQLRTAAQNDTPVYFRVLAEQPATQAGTWQDVYVNTTTLQWLYHPPIPLIAPQNPEHMNLSSKNCNLLPSA